MLTLTDQPQTASAAAEPVDHWRIVLHERTDGAMQSALRFGDSLVVLDDITGARLEKIIERDVSAQHVNAILYVSLAASLGFGVLEAGWRWQFFAGAILFASIAGMALSDILTARRIRYYRLVLHTATGDTRCYTTAKTSDARRLIQRLSQKGIRTAGALEQAA